MLKLLVLLLLVICVFAEKVEETSEKCKEIFEPHRENVLYCCDSVEPDFDECRMFCTDQTDVNCSCAICLREIDLVSREKDQFLKMYDRRLNEEFTADEKKSWLPVLNKSFEHCKPLMDILNGTDECEFPKYYQPMVTCMRQQNFVNCPQSLFALSEKCEATRKFIKEQETCGTKYEDIFVIDDSIFDQENKCEEIFKGANLNSKNIVDFPYISPPIYVFFSCAQKCSWNLCCITPCILNVTSFDDFAEEVVKDKIIEFSKSDCKESGINYDIWKPVIESSFGICYPLASTVIGSKKCDIRMKFRSLVFCMRQELFLNAPSSLIKDPDQFEKIKTFIENEIKCGQNLGDKFIIDGSFWIY